MNAEDESPRDRSRRLRAESTTEEQTLWRQLRARRLGGFNFGRQHRLGRYFLMRTWQTGLLGAAALRLAADFCYIERRLIVELDGSQHAEPGGERRDVAILEANRATA